ncbi:Retinoic acid induced 16-like protein-domain-containing protein [Rhodotorula diobovata]|uniref:Retinoic acid induced 16-like protein-domain-containing protein n=1 Tax=Rhodotorula diobovata TaxID=5288 RepID=A0A5C5FV71_9BASI|nr:Retinoic acid induced 16-like protein-domain-containing protein [Rhodotorula diobovata]
MWSRVAKLASPAPRKPAAPAQRSPASVTASLNELEAILGDSSSATPGAVAHILAQLLGALKAGAAEAESAGVLPEGLEHLLREGSLGTLVDRVEHEAALREELVRWYGRAIIELDEGWLSHSAVNRPLVRLLRRCVDEDGGLDRTEELAVVQVMCTVAERIKTRPELLAIFFREKAPRFANKDVVLNRPVPLTAIPEPPASPTLSQATMSDVSLPFAASHGSTASPRRRAEHDFLLFSYLLRFVHREGEIGDSAREGVLSLVDVALGYPALYNPSLNASGALSPTPTAPAAAREAVLAFAEYLLDSDFADVLGAGLGALYGLLPTKLVVRADSAAASGTATGDAQVAGGMVLGGMGALHDDEAGAEAAERRREEEELRLRGEGYGITGTAEFREGLDGFLKLVEFTRDVLRRSTDGLAHSEKDDGDDARQQQLVMSALTGAILSAVRELFLQSVLYPSILECSETDGSAVAVLTYIDALLDVLPEGTKLEAAVLGYLLAEEGAADESSLAARRPGPRHASSSSSSPPQLSKMKRRKSSALLLVERTAPPQQGSDYYDSLGRFSLRDLLISHVDSTSAPTSAAALKLLQTLLTRHDRWSMALLDPVLDESATNFPITLRAAAPSLSDDDDTSDDEALYSYPTSPADDESDSDEFVYPTSRGDPSTPRAARPSAFARTPAAVLRPLLGLPLPSTPSVALHLDLLDTLLSLVGTIDPTYRQMRSAGGGSEMATTGFANYLRDAEASLAGELGFRLAKTGYRHKLRPNAELVALLIESLASFFSHSPDVNLALTGVLASLALSPYRSLEGWLLPVGNLRKAAAPPASPRPRRGSARSPRSDDGDDRSDDYEVDERSRHAALLSPHPASHFASGPSATAPPSATRAALATSDSLLSTLKALAESIEQYRRAIPRFDEYLAERRKGLFFADNLAEALEGDELGAALDENAFARPTPPPTLSPPLAETPPRQQAPRASQLRRSASDESLAPASPSPRGGLAPPPRAAAGTEGQGPASPFAAHYRETGAITVTPVVVASPAAARVRDDDADEREGPGSGPPDSPTRRLGAVPSGATAVSLSTILDNVIVLEEFVKEVAAIVYVRRAVGIDAVRFVE